MVQVLIFCARRPIDLPFPLRSQAWPKKCHVDPREIESDFFSPLTCTTRGKPISVLTAYFFKSTPFHRFASLETAPNFANLIRLSTRNTNFTFSIVVMLHRIGTSLVAMSMSPQDIRVTLRTEVPARWHRTVSHSCFENEGPTAAPLDAPSPWTPPRDRRCSPRARWSCRRVGVHCATSAFRVPTTPIARYERQLRIALWKRQWHFPKRGLGPRERSVPRSEEKEKKSATRDLAHLRATARW